MVGVANVLPQQNVFLPGKLIVECAFFLCVLDGVVFAGEQCCSECCARSSSYAAVFTLAAVHRERIFVSGYSQAVVRGGGNQCSSTCFQSICVENIGPNAF